MNGNMLRVAEDVFRTWPEPPVPHALPSSPPEARSDWPGASSDPTDDPQLVRDALPSGHSDRARRVAAMTPAGPSATTPCLATTNSTTPDTFTCPTRCCPPTSS